MTVGNPLKLALLVLQIASACAQNLPLVNPPSIQTVASLNATANDVAEDPDKRCRAVFSLFQRFIKPGATPDQVHAVLTDTRWLQQTNVVGIYVLTGWIPVKADIRHDTSFVIFVLPAIKPSTGRPPNLGYSIYLTLSGSASRSEKSAFDILRGQGHGTNAALKEFALCYPDGTIECIARSGVRRSNPYVP